MDGRPLRHQENLAFAAGEARLNPLLADITKRPAGTSVLDVFRATTDAMIDGLAATTEDDDFFVVPRIIHGSRVLQERLTMGGSTSPRR